VYQAQHNLAIMYANGRGVGEDQAQALRWFRAAANQGSATDQFMVGGSYMNGYGVEKNLAEAAAWFLKAAEQGNVDAQSTLGGLYYFGVGVPRNYAEAYLWLNLAAAGGDQTATKLRLDAETSMSPDQIASAQQRSLEWQQRHTSKP
jgi:uncharacterized protein